MPKPDKQIIVDAIIKGIEQGLTKVKILAKHGEKWRIGSRTYDRYWKTANEQHIVRQQAIKNKLAEIDAQAAIEARKKAIMTAEERKEVLTKIALGHLKIKKPFVIGGKIMEYSAEPDHTDRKNAIAELNKMEGDYSPQRVAQTDSKGNDLDAEIDYSRVPNNVLKELLNAAITKNKD